MLRRSAFTLLELMLVLAIILIVTAISYPSLQGYIADARLQAGADHLRAKFADARSYAIDSSQPYLFSVKPGESGYRLAPDMSSQSNNGQSSDPQSVDPNAIVVQDSMPSNIRFNLDASAASGVSSGDGYIGVISFLPDGSCSDDKVIRLDLDGANPIEISIRGLTGAVKVRYVQAGN
jgi:prepilin-type N-terminal cleavage/methylation domain-containing protein